MIWQEPQEIQPGQMLCPVPGTDSHPAEYSSVEKGLGDSWMSHSQQAPGCNEGYQHPGLCQQELRQEMEESIVTLYSADSAWNTASNLGSLMRLRVDLAFSEEAGGAWLVQPGGKMVLGESNSNPTWVVRLSKKWIQALHYGVKKGNENQQLRIETRGDYNYIYIKK